MLVCFVKTRVHVPLYETFTSREKKSSEIQLLGGKNASFSVKTMINMIGEMKDLHIKVLNRRSED